MALAPVALTLTLACLACTPRDGTVPAEPPTPPEVDISAMQEPVAAAIEAARGKVLEQPGAAEPWGRLGRIFHAHGLHPQAVACYLEAHQRAPEDYRWPYLAAMAQQKLDLSAARELFETAARQAPRNPAFYIHYGDLLMNRGEPAEAERRYRTALEQAPRSSHALHGLARIEMLRGDVDAARTHLETAVEAAPSHGEAHTLLAQIYHRQGEEEKARQAELRGRIHADASRAEDPVLDAMEAEGVGARAHERRGLWLARAGRWAEAEREFRRVLQIRSGNVRDYANLGGALARQGEHRKALEVYEEALRLQPGEPSTLNNLATTRMALGELDRATELLEQVLEGDPRNAGARYNLGLVRFRQGRLSEAEALYREALRLDPTLLPAYADLGNVLAMQGRLSEAVTTWRRSLSLDSRQVPVLYNLAAVQAQRGEHEAAIESLRQGLRLAPDASRLVSLLAWELATAPEPGLRDGAEARRLAERVVAASPRPEALDVWAAALAEEGSFEAAGQAARRALELAESAGNARLAQEIRHRLELYSRGRPYRQTLAPRG